MTKVNSSGIPTGVSREGMTELHLDMQSIKGGNQSMSDMSATTQDQNPSFQPTENSAKEIPEKVQNARLMFAFATKLKKLGILIPKKVTFPNGEKGWVLFMPESLWEIDSQTRELRPR